MVGRGSNVRFSSGELVATLCFALCVWSGQMTNTWVFPSVATVFPFARDAGMLCVTLAYVSIVLCACYRPRCLGRAVGVVSLASLVLACVLAVSGLELVSPITACVFCISYTVGLVFPEILSFIALSRLASNVRRLCCISVAFIACALAGIPQIDLGASGGAMVRLVIFLLVVALLWKDAGGVLGRLSDGLPAADLEAEAPRSFLAPMHAFFPCVFLVSVIAAFGSMISQGGQAGALSHVLNAAAVIVAFLVAFKRKASEDMLFTCVYLGILAGLLLVPFSENGMLPAARMVISACSTCFSVLYMLVVSSVGSRNIFALLPTLGIASAVNGFGTMVGAIMGDFASSHATMLTGGAFAAVAAFVFAAFIWLFFKKFSFSETVGSVEPVVEVSLPAEDTETLSLRSKRVAARCGLTAREGEILDLLAHGRNTRFIQEKLVISPNTVRTHIKHIYQKLDVHSQQELIDFVSSG